MATLLYLKKKSSSTITKSPAKYNIAGHSCWFAIIFALHLLGCSKSDTKSNQPPTISGITPASGDLGATVTISGTNFGTTGATVNFNGVQATITSATPTTIVAEVPLNATTGPVSVITANGTASSQTFTYVPDIIVAGGESNTSGTTIAKYWKNGVAVPVTDGSNNALAYSMFVSGPDIYLAGYENKGSVSVAKYWKNGTAVSLGNGTQNSGASSIFISGTDVYVAGSESNGTHTVAKYWKNGVAVPLSNGQTDAWATSITLSGQDIYVAGFQTAPSPIAITYAKYWKNGKSVVLTDSTTYPAQTTSIAVSAQGDVYVSGYAYNSSTTFLALFWKNGTPAIVSGSTAAWVDNIIVAGTHVYMAGYDNGQAEYWVDNAETPLTTTGNGAKAHSVFVYGNDVYAAGNQSNGTHRVAKYWKNGVETSVTDGTADAFIWSIVVR
jgi:hypothetical protein